jgi:light-regulated signal transduction histidine kinase (bacteriophytochrome)
MEDTVNAPNITPQVAVSEAALPLVSTLARNGLGLSIARQIVESHGGSLNIESTPGDGSTFVTRVPLNADPPPET